MNDRLSSGHRAGRSPQGVEGVQRGAGLGGACLGEEPGLPPKHLSLVGTCDLFYVLSIMLVKVFHMK